MKHFSQCIRQMTICKAEPPLPRADQLGSITQDHPYPESPLFGQWQMKGKVRPHSLDTFDRDGPAHTLG